MSYAVLIGVVDWKGERWAISYLKHKDFKNWSTNCVKKPTTTKQITFWSKVTVTPFPPNRAPLLRKHQYHLKGLHLNLQVPPPNLTQCTWYNCSTIVTVHHQLPLNAKEEEAVFGILAVSKFRGVFCIFRKSHLQVDYVTAMRQRMSKLKDSSKCCDKCVLPFTRFVSGVFLGHKINF